MTDRHHRPPSPSPWPNSLPASSSAKRFNDSHLFAAHSRSRTHPRPAPARAPPPSSCPPRWPVEREAPALGAGPLASTYFICPGAAGKGAWQKPDKITCEFLIDTQQEALKYR